MSSNKLERETVLVVDDTPDNLALLNEMLKEHYRIQLAINGEQALEICADGFLPDIILLDVMMPGIDGYEVCRRLKANERTKNIPVLFVSSLAEITNVITGFQAGGVDYVTKPFLFEEVFARIQVHLNLRRAQKEVQSLLSQTLTGSIKVMLDMLSISQPETVEQAYRLRRYSQEMLKGLPSLFPEAWAVEMAAMLVKIGSISVPPVVLQRREAGIELTSPELEHLKVYPLISAEIVRRIPRMENVADIIGNQMKPVEELASDARESICVGSLILHMILAYDQMIAAKKLPIAAAELIATRMPATCPEALIQALKMIAVSESSVIR